ncbi:hypothetical protein BOX15_Mlig011996g2 [Macrostomum lignano]|uniref:PQ-loop repeat-containing protein 1 n=1 Tax=Macrostomum lignano TaxID=282301 RepID=A0A267GMF6_9PLAT|nr:hypothetical protein BOX15_Mlig011996g2 [Macrostomum lignano]
MVFGGVVPYVPQYLQIKRTGNTEGFSSMCGLTLLLANILRILFWFCKHFELPLLAQSFVMIFTMLCMVHIYVRTDRRLFCLLIRFGVSLTWRAPTSGSGRISSATCNSCCYSQSQHPASPTPVRPARFCRTAGISGRIFRSPAGRAAVLQEFKERSTDGMSIAMVAMWTSGDIFKTSYFIVRSAPVQFWLCGLLQVGIDLAIFGQVYLYSAKPPPL